MKPLKFIVALAAGAGAGAVFSNWISVRGDGALAAAAASSLPVTGMQNGGALLLALFIVVLAMAVAGIARRYGRGLAIPSALIGAVLTFFALAKYRDIASAQAKLGALGDGLVIAPTAALVLVLAASLVTLAASILAVAKPEPR